MLPVQDPESVQRGIQIIQYQSESIYRSGLHSSSWLVNSQELWAETYFFPTDSCDINVSPDKRTILIHSEDNLVAALKVTALVLNEVEDKLSPIRRSHLKKPLRHLDLPSQCSRLGLSYKRNIRPKFNHQNRPRLLASRYLRLKILRAKAWVNHIYWFEMEHPHETRLPKPVPVNKRLRVVLLAFLQELET